MNCINICVIAIYSVKVFNVNMIHEDSKMFLTCDRMNCIVLLQFIP